MLLRTPACTHSGILSPSLNCEMSGVVTNELHRLLGAVGTKATTGASMPAMLSQKSSPVTAAAERDQTDADCQETTHERSPGGRVEVGAQRAAHAAVGSDDLPHHRGQQQRNGAHDPAPQEAIRHAELGFGLEPATVAVGARANCLNGPELVTCWPPRFVNSLGYTATSTIEPQWRMRRPEGRRSRRQTNVRVPTDPTHALRSSCVRVRVAASPRTAGQRLPSMRWR